MRLETRATGPFSVNVYLLIHQREAAVIDPGGELDWIEEICQAEGAEIRYLLLTHGHVDHVAELAQAHRRWPKAEIALHAGDLFLLSQAPRMGRFFGFNVSQPPSPTMGLEQDQEIKLGGLTLRVDHFPGHCPGHVAFTEVDEGISFSGDILFQGSIGRTDLPGGDYQMLQASLQRYTQRFAAQTRILPGHGPETTLGRELGQNPFFDWRR